MQWKKIKVGKVKNTLYNTTVNGRWVRGPSSLYVYGRVGEPIPLYAYG